MPLIALLFTFGDGHVDVRIPYASGLSYGFGTQLQPRILTTSFL